MTTPTPSGLSPEREIPLDVTRLQAVLRSAAHSPGLWHHGVQLRALADQLPALVESLAALDGLRAENDELREITELRRIQIERLRGDAERLDWLERWPIVKWNFGRLSATRVTNGGTLETGHHDVYGKSLRAAIDAAQHRRDV